MITSKDIKSSDQAAEYFDQAFNAENIANGADNYYLGEMADMKWQGKGAALLGMEGKQVERQAFIDILDGKVKNLTTGGIQDLTENGHSNRRKGRDLTFSAPKSISIMALVAKDERLVQAHIEATAGAMAWLEEHGAWIRVKDGQGGNVTENTGNLVWGTVVHETNRLNEPQLHSHNVVMAMTWDESRDTWRSLTNDEVTRLRNSADDIYKGLLTSKVRANGYEVEFSENGRDFELKGVGKDLIDAFSGRQKQIEDHIRSRGYDPETASWAMRQAAALDSRDKKQDIPSEVIHNAWDGVVKSHGADLTRLVDESRERSAAASPILVRLENQRLAGMAVSNAIEHLSERQQVFSASELEHTAVLFGKAHIEDVRLAIKDHLEGHQLIAGSLAGRVDVVYTTQKGLDAERQTLSIIREGRGQGTAVINSETEFRVLLKQFEDNKTEQLGKPFALSQEQVAASRNVLMHQDQFQGIQGDAGTGKTAALEFVRSVADQKGWSIQGVAVTSSAAKELQQSTGIPSKTVAGFFADRANSMNSLRLEIAQLEQWVYGKAPLEQSAAPRIEIKDLQAKSFDLNFGRNVYIFDHQRGNVFKAGSGLIDRFAVNVLQKVDEYRSTAETGAWKDKVAGVAERLAMSSITARKVGVVEGHSARQALYQENRDATMRKLATVLDEKKTELTRLEGAGGAAQSKTIYIMDESSLTGAIDMHRFVEFSGQHAARVVLQGDIKQHGSVAAGRSFEQMQTGGLNLSTLTETRRFDNATAEQKAAVVAATNQNFEQAIEKLPRLEVQGHQVHKLTADRYLENLRDLQGGGKQNPTVAVIAVTNADRKMANAEIHSLLHLHGLLGSEVQTKAHFDPALLTKAQMRNVSALARGKVDRLVFQQNYSEIGVKRGDVLVIERLDQGSRRIIGALERNGMTLSLNPDKQSEYSVFRAEERNFAVGDKVEARAAINGERGENLKIGNGSRGVVTGVNQTGLEIKWSDGTSNELNNQHARFIDHAYAHTTIKDQGATYDRLIIAASDSGSKVFNEQSTLVAVTRAKDNTEIITSDYEGMLKSVGKEVDKPLAADVRPLEKTTDLKIDVGNKDKGQDLGKVAQKDQREFSI